MASYKVKGGRLLSGSVSVSGSINGALPAMCATLLTDKRCVLRNVPDVTDIRNMIKILSGLGSKIRFINGNLEIDNSAVNSFEPQKDLVKSLRGSILLIGPLLARFGEVQLPYPGGDLIGRRPIDTHLSALQVLGAKIEKNGRGENHRDLIKIKAARLNGTEVILNEMSVTATENAIMAGVSAKGTTRIHLAATEPHVQGLCVFLNKIDAKISGIGTHDLLIKGVDKLEGAEHAIIFDNEMATSFMNLAAAAKSEIMVENVQPQYLYSAIAQLKMMGANFDISSDSILMKKPASEYKAAKIVSNIYPGLLTDYLPPFSVLATQAKGASLIHEWMYEGRLGYIHELSKMGAKARILDQHRAEIEGPTSLHGTNVSSLDVRSGMVMIIAALVGSGSSVLHDAEHIERKYENIVGRLTSLGADIERFD